MTELLEGTVAKAQYSAADIQVLEGLEAVRLRPGMYIGSTDERGLHHLVYEIVDNAVDEAMAGFCDKVGVTILADGSVKIEDNGRGVPVEKHAVTGVSTVTLQMRSPGPGPRAGRTPLPRSLNNRPVWVSAGTFRLTRPPRVGTSSSPPSAAMANPIGTSQNRFAPSRMKIGWSRT